MNLDKFKAKKLVKLYNGKTQLQCGDFIDGETVQVSIINADGMKENIDCVFSMDLMEELQNGLEKGEAKAITVFKR